MKPEINNSAYYPEQQGTADLKNFLSQIARNWYWFVLSIFFGISVAWAYNRYMPPEYSIHSSLLINQYESGIKRLSLSQNSTNDRNIDIISQDHAGRLKSHLINFNTLQSLGWNISWYQKNILFSKDLYNQEPYTLSLLSDKKNLTEVPVQITEISSTEYQVDYELVRANQNSPQSFSQKGILFNHHSST